MDALVLDEKLLRSALNRGRRLLRENIMLKRKIEEMEKEQNSTSRIGFYVEDGTVMTEFQKITQVNTEEAKARFKINVKPVYLQIFFHTPMLEDELVWLYQKIREHGIIEMSDDDILANVMEDSKKDRLGSYEFRSTNFCETFNCAREICQSDIYWEGRMTVQISEDPTWAMKQWLKEKELRAKNTLINEKGV